MIKSSLACLLCLVALSGCVVADPQQLPATATGTAALSLTPPEVNIVSDYPPVKAIVVPAMKELGYTVAQDSQYWTIFTKAPPTGSSTPLTRLTVTFASIRTHTRVIADTGYVMNPGTQTEQYVPAPDHPDRNAIQAKLDQAKRDVEKRPDTERHAPAPPPAHIAATPAAPVASATATPGTSPPTPAFTPTTTSSQPSPALNGEPLTRVRIQ